MTAPRAFTLLALACAAGLSLVARAGESAAPAVSTAAEPPPLLRGEPVPTAPPVPPTDPAEAFAVGVAAYDKGDYAAARAAFAAAAKTTLSPALEYNLGNACFETGEPAVAMVHYLRALALDPRNPDARANLAFARQALGAPAPEPSARERLLAWMGEAAWLWLAVLAGWAALYLLLLPRLFRWRGPVPWLLFLVALGLAAAGATALWTAHEHARDGVVLRDDTPMRISPTKDGRPVGVLQAGDLAETLERHGAYYRVRAPGGASGWVAEEHFTPVRP